MTEASAHDRALGTDVHVVVTRPQRLAAAKQAVDRVLRDIDDACSRFREDSELSRVNGATGREQTVSPLLAMAIGHGLRAAQVTDGDVDPTVGAAMRVIGYDVAAAGVRIIKTPVRAPRANAIAERWIGSARRECLDRMLVTGERHLRPVLSEYTDHYNVHRPHRALHQNPPAGRAHPHAEVTDTRVLRRDRLGGLIHEYAQVA